jgi:branched-chain amino acid transport system substrate-binding protein
MRGFKDGVGTSKQAKIVADATYSTADATVDSQLTAFKASGADTFFDEATPKFAAQGIAKAYEIGWKPMLLLPTVSTSVASVLKPAGLEKSVGVVAPAYIKDPSDNAWNNDESMKNWRAWLGKYHAEANAADPLVVQGYTVAELTVEVLKRCGDNLTRENIMKQVSNLQGLQLSMLLPGVQINTTPSDYRIVRKFQFQRFNGTSWERFGELVGD